MDGALLCKVSRRDLNRYSPVAFLELKTQPQRPRQLKKKPNFSRLSTSWGRTCSKSNLTPAFAKWFDFFDVLKGELYGPLKSQVVFDRVRLEHGNLVWLNGADFDPEILHDWLERKTAMIAAAVVDTKQCCD